MTLCGLIGSAIVGVLSYLLTKFWLEPILRYQERKREVHVDLIYFGNALSLGPGASLSDRSDPHVQRIWERMDANRKRSAELAAAYRELPLWYQNVLARRNEDPERAARELIGLSNNFESGQTSEWLQRITQALGLPRV